MNEMRDYFERGCKCLRDGIIQPYNGEDDEAAVVYYMENCHCSRHPDYHE